MRFREVVLDLLDALLDWQLWQYRELSWVRDRIKERWTSKTTVHEARSIFRQLYPGARLLKVRLFDDVKTARTYTYVYASQTSKKKEVQLQFLRDKGTGRWRLQSHPPSELP